MKCVVGIFGLDRSLRWTRRSIERNILSPLDRAGYQTDLVIHLNRPTTIHSPRSGELNIRHGSENMERLRPKAVRLEPQDDDLLATWLALARAYPYRKTHDEGGFTRRNVVYQLHSLQRLGDIIVEEGLADADVFVLIRPDLLYLDKIAIGECIEPVARGQFDLVTPGWHEWDGLNDRFCIANARGMRAYTQRMALLEEFCRDAGMIHSESILKLAADRAGLRLGKMPVRAVRVRANGRVQREQGLRLSLMERLWLKSRSLLQRLDNIVFFALKIRFRPDRHGNSG